MILRDATAADAGALDSFDLGGHDSPHPTIIRRTAFARAGSNERLAHVRHRRHLCDDRATFGLPIGSLVDNARQKTSTFSTAQLKRFVTGEYTKERALSYTQAVRPLSIPSLRWQHRFPLVG